MRDYNSRLSALRDQRPVRSLPLRAPATLPLERMRTDPSGVPVALVVIALVVGVWIGAVVTAGAL